MDISKTKGTRHRDFQIANLFHVVTFILKTPLAFQCARTSTWLWFDTSMQKSVFQFGIQMARSLYSDGFTHISYFDVLVLLLTFITGCQSSGTLNSPNGGNCHDTRHPKRGGLAASAFFSWLMQCIVYFLASLAPKYSCQPTIMRQRRSSHRIDESKRCNKLVALILTSMRHLGFLIKKLEPDDCVVQAPIKKGAGKSSQTYAAAMRRWALFLSGLWGFCRQRGHTLGCSS